MNEFENIIRLGKKGSKIFAEQFNQEELNKLLTNLTTIENSEVIDSSKLDELFGSKENFAELKRIIIDAILINGNCLIIYEENKLDSLIDEHVVIEELKPVPQKVDLGVGSNADKQFFYNYKQANMEVTHQLSFDVEVIFEPLAPIPLILGYDTQALNREISVEINFIL